MYDILIVGGGPAGLTAAIYATRAGKTVAVLERAVTGGQIIYSPQVDNYPALPHVSGADFAVQLSDQVTELGVDVLYTEVTGAERTEAGFRLTTDSGTQECRALILAAGVQHRKLGVAGEEELTGRGVSYCAVCDGAFYAGKSVAVVGGGDTALQDALFLAGVCGSVTLLVRRDRFRGEAKRAEALRQKPNVDIRFRRTVEELRQADGMLNGLVLKDQDSGALEEFPVDGLFLAVGQEPCGGVFSGLVDVDAQGYIVAGENGETGTPGVFAAGDCRTKEVRQLTTAVGDGANAAVAACNYLDDHG